MRVLSSISGTPAGEFSIDRTNPQRIWLQRSVGFKCRNPTGLGEIETSLLKGTHKISCEVGSILPLLSAYVSLRGSISINLSFHTCKVATMVRRSAWSGCSEDRVRKRLRKPLARSPQYLLPSPNDPFSLE